MWCVLAAGTCSLPFLSDERVNYSKFWGIDRHFVMIQANVFVHRYHVGKWYNTWNFSFNFESCWNYLCGAQKARTYDIWLFANCILHLAVSKIHFRFISGSPNAFRMRKQRDVKNGNVVEIPILFSHITRDTCRLALAATETHHTWISFAW